MILCVTPNPALDRVLVVPQLVAGQVHRTQGSLVTAGGKGINVARVIQTLGGQAVCLGLLGGHTGRFLAELVQQENLPSQWTWTESETRTSVIIIQENHGEATVINEPGAPVSEADWLALQRNILREAQANPEICFCGSLPPGIAPEWFAALLTSLIAQGAHVWVDGSGPGLAAAARVPGVRLKINGAEVAALLGTPPITTATEAQQACQQLQALAVHQGAITLGSAGAVAFTPDGCWLAQPPTLTVVSAVGSGDSFLGGWLVAGTQGAVPDQCLRWACAAGAANALSPASGRLAPADFRRLLDEVQITTL